MLRLRPLDAFGVIAFSGPVLAHDGREHEQAAGWTLDPSITVPLGLLLALFLIGSSRLRSRSSVERRRSWLFVLGWLVLALSLVTPLHEGGERSFTLHMIEHELIMLVATFLLAASHAGGQLAWGLPATARRGLGGRWKVPLTWIWRRLTEPVTATILQSVVMWTWHAPGLFDRALGSQAWHVAQHLSFILASLIFWTAMLGTRRGGHLLSAACLFATSLVEGALGALMALSASPWYPAYAAMDLSGIGLDPTTDQQLAGLIMWIPGGLVHGGAALALLYAWLKANGGAHAESAR
jgi:putative membrane protein